MRHTAAINTWRIIKLSFFIMVAVVMYYLIKENESLQRDNVTTAMALDNLSRTCISVGKP